MKGTFYVAEVPEYLDNKIFTASQFSNGLKNYFFLFVELRRQLAAHGITLDTQDITPVAEADLIIAIDQVAFFQTYTRLPGQRLYLVMNEPATYFPDVWEFANHAVFDRVFTYDYTLTAPRYALYRFALDLASYLSVPPVTAAEFERRRPLLLLAGVVDFNQPPAWSNSLLYARYRSLRWFGQHWPQHFDFFSRGIEEKVYRSFRGLGILRMILPKAVAEGISDVVATRRQRIIEHICRGAVPAHDKLKFIQGYRFMLCYENTALPGYVSEKIFDCLFNGVVPVYLGEPDIGSFVPSACFVDRRAFDSDAALASFLNSLTYAEYAGYQKAAMHFITSENLLEFGSEINARRILNVILSDL